MYPAKLTKMLSVLAVAGLSACADAGDRGLGPACESNLAAAERALARAKANSVGKVVDWTAAAALIAAARTQQKFDEFENCVQKARKARDIIARQN